MKLLKPIIPCILAGSLIISASAQAMYSCLPTEGAVSSADSGTTISEDENGNLVIEITNTSENTEDSIDIVIGSEDTYESENSESVTVYATTNVNVRTGPSTDDSIVATLKRGNSVTRIATGEDGWDTVLYNNQTCYIASRYLSETDPTETVIVDDDAYPLTYEDDTASITITKELYCGSVCYVAHLVFSDYSRFGTACANDSYGSYETTSSAAERLGAILTVNGDYSAPSLNYGVVRSGVVYNDKGCSVPAVYSSVTGLFQSPESAGVYGTALSTLAASKTVTDTFCFGPAGLINGVVSSNSDTSRAQRTFIGTNGTAGDLYIVVSEGRYADGTSAGLTFQECMQLLADKGCTFGIPLDGGGSSTMVFQGTVLNSAAGNERAVVDFLYFR